MPLQIHSMTSSRTPEGQPARFPAIPGLESLDFVVREAILRDLPARTKADAVALLVRRLSDLGYAPAADLDEIVAAVLFREELGPTGVGRGVAIPHVKHPSVSRVVAGIGYSPAGIDFDSLDGKPVTVIVLVLSPARAAGDHLRALAQIAGLVRDAK
jgi:PTS system fructose-specific IIA component/PTS system nitrogen regulatory IIA component